MGPIAKTLAIRYQQVSLEYTERQVALDLQVTTLKPLLQLCQRTLFWKTPSHSHSLWLAASPVYIALCPTPFLLVLKMLRGIWGTGLRTVDLGYKTTVSM